MTEKTDMNEGDDSLVGIRVSVALVNKAIKKLNMHPNSPAVYVVDSVLRIFTEGS